MRKIDLSVGKPLTSFLSLFFGSHKPRKIPAEKVQSIIVSKYFGIGSIALSTSLLQSLKEDFPGSKLSFITFRNNEELLKFFPFVDNVLTIRNDTFTHFVLDTIRIISSLRLKARPTLFIDMEFLSHYSALVAWLSGARYRVGFHHPLLPRGKILTHRVSFNTDQYIAQSFIALGKKIGAEKDFSMFRLKVDGTYREMLVHWLKKRELHEKAYIVINTQCADHLADLKRWQVDKWGELISRIITMLKLPVILTGMKNNRAAIEDMISSIPQQIRKSVLNTAGEFSLGEFLALLEMARLLITVDSGPLHLAQLLHVPCIALFGPETPVLYGPQNEHDETVYLNLSCSPCCTILDGKKAQCTKTDYNACMRDITVETVWRRVADLNQTLEKKYNQNISPFLTHPDR